MGKIFQVHVHGPNGEKVLMDLCNTEEQMQNMTVYQLKQKIEEKFTMGGEIRLFFADKVLEEDSKKLSEYGVQHMSIILMVLRLPGGLTV